MARFTLGQTCCTSPGAMWFWAAAFVVLYGLGLLADPRGPQSNRMPTRCCSGRSGWPVSSTLVATARCTAGSPDRYF
jgi:hypothetical protein